jgi:hypothetical protein
MVNIPFYVSFRSQLSLWSSVQQPPNRCRLTIQTCRKCGAGTLTRLTLSCEIFCGFCLVPGGDLSEKEQELAFKAHLNLNVDGLAFYP